VLRTPRTRVTAWRHTFFSSMVLKLGPNELTLDLLCLAASPALPVHESQRKWHGCGNDIILRITR
jgi:hypothetical protein